MSEKSEHVVPLVMIDDDFETRWELLRPLVRKALKHIHEDASAELRGVRPEDLTSTPKRSDARRLRDVEMTVRGVANVTPRAVSDGRLSVQVDLDQVREMKPAAVFLDLELSKEQRGNWWLGFRVLKLLYGLSHQPGPASARSILRIFNINFSGLFRQIEPALDLKVPVFIISRLTDQPRIQTQIRIYDNYWGLKIYAFAWDRLLRVDEVQVDFLNKLEDAVRNYINPKKEATKNATRTPSETARQEAEPIGVR